MREIQARRITDLVSRLCIEAAYQLELSEKLKS